MNCCLDYREKLGKLNSDLRNLQLSVSSEIDLERVRYNLVAVLLSLLRFNNKLKNIKLDLDNAFKAAEKIDNGNGNYTIKFYYDKEKTILAPFNLQLTDVYINDWEWDSSNNPGEKILILNFNDANKEPLRIPIPDIHLQSAELNDNELVLTLTDQSEITVNLNPIILKIPLVPGYYFSNNKYTSTKTFSHQNIRFGDAYNNIDTNIEYIGVDLIEHPYDNLDHQYIFEVKDRNNYRFVELYNLPKPNCIYFVSSNYTNALNYSIDNNNPTEITYPTGKLAYFEYTLNGWNLKEFGILENVSSGIIETSGNKKFYEKKSSGIGSAIQFGVNSYGFENKEFFDKYYNIFKYLKENNLKYCTVSNPSTDLINHNKQFLNIFNEGTTNRLSNYILDENGNLENSLKYTLSKFSDKYGHLWYIHNDTLNELFNNNNYTYDSDNLSSPITNRDNALYELVANTDAVGTDSNLKKKINKYAEVRESFNVADVIRFDPTILRNTIDFTRLHYLKRNFPDSKYENVEWIILSDVSDTTAIRNILNSNDQNPPTKLRIFEKESWNNYNKLTAIWKYLLGQFYSSNLGITTSGYETVIPNIALLKTYKEDIGWSGDYLDWTYIGTGSNLQFTQYLTHTYYDNSSNNFTCNLVIDFDFQYIKYNIHGFVEITVKDFGNKINDDIYALVFTRGRNNTQKDHNFLLPNIEITDFDAIFSNGLNDVYRFYKSNIIVNLIEHGRIIVPDIIEEGEPVEIIVEPDSGYELDTLTITYVSNNHTINILPSSTDDPNKYTFTKPELLVNISATFTLI